MREREETKTKYIFRTLVDGEDEQTVGHGMDREDIYYIKEVGNPINISRGIWVATKDRLILKADWRAIDSPKKRTDKFVLFAVKSKKANVRFWENLLLVLSDH